MGTALSLPIWLSFLSCEDLCSPSECCSTLTISAFVYSSSTIYHFQRSNLLGPFKTWGPYLHCFLLFYWRVEHHCCGTFVRSRAALGLTVGSGSCWRSHLASFSFKLNCFGWSYTLLLLFNCFKISAQPFILCSWRFHPGYQRLVVAAGTKTCFWYSAASCSWTSFASEPIVGAGIAAILGLVVIAWQLSWLLSSVATGNAVAPHRVSLSRLKLSALPTGPAAFSWCAEPWLDLKAASLGSASGRWSLPT